MLEISKVTVPTFLSWQQPSRAKNFGNFPYESHQIGGGYCCVIMVNIGFL